MANGHGAQIVKITETHTYELDELELEKTLMRDDVKDLPAMVVSVTGAYRRGKSFLLNFFLRYLTATPSAQKDGSWLGGPDDPLTGFQWSSGVKRITTGLLLWSEPIITTLPSGEKVAVLLIDTQGAFDSKSTVRDSSTIFAMSTLLSSVQIYNLSHNIQEDDLQQLQLFTEYANLVNVKEGKAFQVLKFLVRDWQYSYEYAYGAVGGEQLLQEVMMKSGIPKELQDLRQHILSSFDSVSCFLLPHPGFIVLKSDSTGKISDIDTQFKEHLLELVRSLFSPENLLPKTVNRQVVKARELFQYFKTYLTLFNSNDIPTPTSIMQATVEAGLRSLVNEAREKYEQGMDAECGEKEPNVPAVDINELHLRYMSAARTFFSIKKKMGSEKDIDIYLQKLTKELDNRLPQFVQMNQAKSQAAMDAAIKLYEQTIQSINEDTSTVCLHPLDLDKIHKVGVDAAMDKFDSLRKRVTNQQDVERPLFFRSFQKRHELLKLTNESNNMMNVSEISKDYWEKMQAKITKEKYTKDSDIALEHETAMKRALDEFDSKRNKPSQYTEDTFKASLVTMINNNYTYLKTLNKSLHTLAIQAAVERYDELMRANVRECLHPEDLEREHQQGLCHALAALRPEKKCSDGFDYTDEDEMTLMGVLHERHQNMVKLNNYINTNAVQKSLTLYNTSMEELCRPSLYWVLIHPMLKSLGDRTSFHDESKAKALTFFNGKRKTTGLYSGKAGTYATDPFKDQLIQQMDSAYTKLYKINGAELLPLVSQGVKFAQDYLMKAAAVAVVA